MQDEPAAFDLWLRRDLRQRFNAITREPLPEELTRLLDRLPQTT